MDSADVRRVKILSMENIGLKNIVTDRNTTLRDIRTCLSIAYDSIDMLKRELDQSRECYNELNKKYRNLKEEVERLKNKEQKP